MSAQARDRSRETAISEKILNRRVDPAGNRPHNLGGTVPVGCREKKERVKQYGNDRNNENEKREVQI